MHGMQGTREYQLLLYSPDTIMTTRSTTTGLLPIRMWTNDAAMYSTTCMCMRVRKERISKELPRFLMFSAAN